MWKPQLFQRELYSEILDKKFPVTVTMRTLDLIDEAYGFDFYILKARGFCLMVSQRGKARSQQPLGHAGLWSGGSPMRCEWDHAPFGAAPVGAFCPQESLLLWAALLLALQGPSGHSLLFSCFWLFLPLFWPRVCQLLGSIRVGGILAAAPGPIHSFLSDPEGGPVLQVWDGPEARDAVAACPTGPPAAPRRP